ncbi:unnamed protein product [Heligmosomoides polygyrus]|uniref:AAA_12 domain-containing protein n=1 Tax=Heligmosomoides polygyrus TaxID=6339 RepID=A0A183G7S9_HELPZ|nr:unnamed protein product [Heligmosomoides polygyrus]
MEHRTLDEASMIPEATLIALCSRFQQARYTLAGESKQMPPEVGVRDVPKAAALCSQSVLDVAHRMENAPVCNISTVYCPHAGVMMINSEFLYDNKLQCGTLTASRQNLLSRLKMPNPEVPFVFLNVIGHSVKSVTGSHSNEIEAKAVRVLVCLLKAKGIPAEDILEICLYRDQKYLCDRILQDTQVSVATVDSAEGCERSIVIVCMTRTHNDRNANHTFLRTRGVRNYDLRFTILRFTVIFGKFFTIYDLRHFGS